MKIQYVIVRRDTEFTHGATIAQAVHAVTLCQHTHFDKDYLEYCQEGFAMRTVILQCTQENMPEIIKELQERKIKHCVWREMPEDIETAIALYPYEKDLIKAIPAIRKLKLY
ncbi:hypothetical protein NERG_01776 [Nematocida ausubeli]|uniref:peptidyl-tRNA hydrolase n=1 Tax=Nematocida ausubeli (strain ATCC PRA-371 / ERTm2) TaxID=1913371 RepID=H8ZDV5_NEMA1|nr:hypothetical protein NERG_01776 [Nematocida ausubeli]